MNEIGRRLINIKAIFVTHDHIDHIKGIQELTQSNKIPVYATASTLKGITMNRFTANVDLSCLHAITYESPIIIGGIKITAFEVDHDAEGAAGYHIENSHQKITIATDLGQIGRRAAHYLQQSNVMVLESNYDEKMLAEGPYPPYLQERIRSKKGHLGNHQTAEFLANCLANNTSHVFLAHLSEHNNRSEIALRTIQKAVGYRDSRPLVQCLPRKQRSELHRF